MKDNILAWTIVGLSLFIFWNILDYYPFNALLLPFALVKADLLDAYPALLILDLTGSGG